MFAPTANADKARNNLIVSAFPKPVASTYSLPAENFKPVFTIQQAEHDDSEELYTLFTDPMVIYWTVALPYVSSKEIYQQITQSGNGCYTLIAKGVHGVMGSLSLTVNPHPRLRHSAHIGSVAVSPKQQGQGIGKALVKAAVDLADNWLNIHRLDLMVYPDNEGAIALYKKYGFVEEGVLRDYSFRAGRYTDVVVMARIRHA